MTDFTLNRDRGEIGRDCGWALAAGIGYVILGLFAYAWPILSKVRLEFALGTIFVIGGVIEGTNAIRFRDYEK